MAVGKGSMARASKAADNTSVSKEIKETAVTEPVKADHVVTEEPVKKAAATGTKCTATKKAAAKTTTAKTAAKTKAVTASKVISGTSKEVMHMIEYQKSNQVLDREPEENETFGVGDAMPIYFF